MITVPVAHFYGSLSLFYCFFATQADVMTMAAASDKNIQEVNII